MTHWCFDCMKVPSNEEYETCKEKNHEIDYEDLFQPTREELVLEEPKKEQTEIGKKITAKAVELANEGAFDKEKCEAIAHEN